MERESLQFVPFSSMLDTGFWHQLSKRKLDLYRLEELPVPIHGYYSSGVTPGLPAFANVDYSAFNINENSKQADGCFPLQGVLYNVNTFDNFKAINKQNLLNGVGKELWDKITSGEILKKPSQLAAFLLITFADLKKFQFYYWFAFPALNYPEKITHKASVPINQYFSEDQVNQLRCSVSALPDEDKGFYLIEMYSNSSLEVKPLSELLLCLKSKSKVILGFADSSNYEIFPGWTLRNYLALINYHSGAEKSEWDVLCFRECIKDGKRNIERSIVLTISLEQGTKPTSEVPACVGWEKNAQNNLGPRKVDLAKSMDPKKLAESAVDLNLKLMKWRLAPDIDLDKTNSLKCLLFGAGTLGCHVARCLLGWGIKNITFVDNGTVSYSNPVRQSLFSFEDCLDGGKPKAATAAEALKRIYPSVISSGHCITIPMPGHSISESSLFNLLCDLDLVRTKTNEDVINIEELIENHDVVFLLTDTRESRWLPTIIAAAKSKIVINAALGFDTFLVVRHGVKGTLSSDSNIVSETTSFKDAIPGSQVGCYFCNDVVAPGDGQNPGPTMHCDKTWSLNDGRFFSGGVTSQHDSAYYGVRSDAPASTGSGDGFLSESESPLGIVPHQIRGFMSRFYHILPATKAFERCTACSQYVLEEYVSRGFKFLLEVFNNPSYLEEITGLKKLHEETDLAEIWELSDSDSA